MAAAVEGRGFGREAIALLVEYGFLQRNLRKDWLHVHGENRRAQGAYGACGFTEEGRLRAHVWSNGRYDDLLVMGLMIEQWRNHATISAGGARREQPRHSARVVRSIQSL